MLIDRLRTRSGALGDRNFAIFFVGYAVSLTGGGMVPVALTFAILAQGYGGTGVGLVLAAETTAMIALLLLGGAVADRFPRRRVMIAADVIRAVAQFALAGSLSLGHPPLWLIMATGVVLGAGQAFFGPALTGLIPNTTPAAHLQSANALVGLAKWTGQVLGPALAGILVATGGATAAIVCDALTYVVGAACLLAIRIPREGDAGAPEPFLRLLRLGWAEFTAQTWLWIIVVQFGFYRMLVVAPITVLGAVIADQRLGGAAAWGFILSGEGCGAVLGGVIAMRFRPRLPLVWATLGTFSGLPLIVLLAWAGSLDAIIAAAALWGAGLALFTVLFDTTMQRRIPPRSLSRVSSYDWLGSYALAPIGFALAGPLADVLGARRTLETSAAWLLATSVFVLALPEIRRMTNGSDFDPASPRRFPLLRRAKAASRPR